MAAAQSPVRDLCEEATCPICLEYFRDPVIIHECGHNFCRSCLIQCWETSEGEASCPQCRETVEQSSITRNQQLANFVEIIQKFSHPEGKEDGEGKGRVCQKHQEPLKLFCKEDGSPICLVCDRSKEHKKHEVVPLEEASQEYKDQISSCLDNVRKERMKILVLKADTEKESQDLLVSTIVTLRNKQVQRGKRWWLSSGDCTSFWKNRRNFFWSRWQKWRRRLQQKGRSTWPDSPGNSPLLAASSGRWRRSFRNQQVNSCRSQEKENLEDPPVAFPPALKWRIWDFCDINPFLEGVMNQFKDTLDSGLEQHQENVTLDADTANPWLSISEDRKSVRRRKLCKDLPDNPERFDTHGYVLGCEAFTTGRHFWEVIVGREEGWRVGVARKSVKRKGKLLFATREGICGLGKWGGLYKFCSPCKAPVPSEEPKRIRVTLNCEGRRVSFYDADTAALLCTFPAACLSGETLQPYFFVREKGNLRLS
ncbi:E3 ubiquitin-protein ligase TRIM7-like isoform X2 [Zootoca vivipara]|uniref:E3 ubiquitin-protein ligase TRIM7-like isoform X2 n=1 Tax=Zootoca vivipara TaxID=8524 RepID=UPI00293B9A63|nr:E3 ubiquitin-protein ligase TRIM7-like isoform X2 [Zootoca vivipara]